MSQVAIVLLPGLDGTGVMFEPLLAALACELQTIVVSYPVDQELGYEQLLPQVLAAIPKVKPFLLLGESSSGRPAIVFRFFPLMSRIKAWFNKDATPELRELFARKLATIHPRVLAHRVRAVMEIGVVRELKVCAVPVLYLMGERDRVVPGHNMKEIIGVHTGVQVVRLPCSHWVLQSQPRKAAQAIARFVDSFSTQA